MTTMTEHGTAIVLKMANDEIARLRADLAKLNKDREYEIGCLYRTIDRREKEIARLKEALEISSEMMRALGVQLTSWGHESVVNYRGQLAANAAALAPRPEGKGES